MSKMYWTKERVFEESKKYSSRLEFAKNSWTAYTYSSRNKWLDEMTWLAKRHKCQNSVSYDSKEEIFKIAKEYKSLHDFFRYDMKAYSIAKKNHWLGEMTWFASPKKGAHTKWTPIKVKLESRKYKTRTEFYNHCSGAYLSALKLGMLNKLFPKSK